MSWTKQQELDFAELLLVIGEGYGDSVSVARAELYCRVLEDLPFDAVRAAAAQHLKTSPYFPKPSDLRLLVEGEAEDTAELAWQWLLREVRRVGYLGAPRWPDAATQHAAEGLFGGWRALCERLPAEGPELLGFRKAFLAGFQALAARAAAGEIGPSRAEAVSELAEMKRQLQARGLPTGSL